MQSLAVTLKNKIDFDWMPGEQSSWSIQSELSIPEWTERYMVLEEGASEQGPLRLSRTPYIRPILEALEDHQRVVLCKSAQVAGTTAALSTIGYYSHQEPCSIMFVLADELTAKYISEKRIQPIFERSDDLSALAERFNKLELDLSNGAYIVMGWASSVARLSSRPIRVLILDEVDKPGYNLASKEGDAITLGEQRTETFFNRVIFITSTPTVPQGNIIRELEACDVINDFHVPCPHCGTFQPLRWGRKYSRGFHKGLYRAIDGTFKRLGGVHWDGGRNATTAQIKAAGYKCGSCGELWNNAQKNAAVERGQMVARAPLPDEDDEEAFDQFQEGNKAPSPATTGIDAVGFHVNRLYSLLGRSGDISKLVSDWIKAQGSPRKLQGFINSALGEAWEQVVLRVSDTKILSAKSKLEPQVVPADAVAVTAGVDVQATGFYYVVRAWAQDFTSWLIHYGRLGDWEDLDRLLFESRYPYADGGQIGIFRAAVDIGGTKIKGRELSMTEETELWIYNHSFGYPCKVHPVKGASRVLGDKISVGAVRDKTSSGKALKRGLQIISLDTDYFKELYHSRIKNAIEHRPQGAYLHTKTGTDYSSHITAEVQKVNEKGVRVWEQLRAENHLLDCEVYCMAAADLRWPGGGVNLFRRPTAAPKKPQGLKRKKKPKREGRW